MGLGLKMWWGAFVGQGVRTGVRGAPSWGWAHHQPQEALRTLEETWAAGVITLSAPVTGHTRERAEPGHLSAHSTALHGWDLR